MKFGWYEYLEESSFGENENYVCSVGFWCWCDFCVVCDWFCVVCVLVVFDVLDGLLCVVVGDGFVVVGIYLFYFDFFVVCVVGCCCLG